MSKIGGCYTIRSLLMLCDDLEAEWGGRWEGFQDGGNTCIPMADSY